MSTKGVVIFAHNSTEVDYGLLAIISGGLAKKNLNVPVSLIADNWTLDWLKETNMFDVALTIFDKVIEVEKPTSNNNRYLNDGKSFKKLIPFINSNRYSVYELSPYDCTLMIDSDYLIFSDSLNHYWDVDTDVKISTAMNDIKGDRAGVLDKWVSEPGVQMYWATTVMFNKTSYAKTFFDLVEHIRDNYVYYGNLYKFNYTQYRNDIAFSIALHILNGYENNSLGHLPPVLSTFDIDVLVDVKLDTHLTFLIDNPYGHQEPVAASIKNTDVHVMNKQSILRYKDILLEMI